MDWLVLALIVLAIVAYVAGPVVAILGTVDALGYPPAVWTALGRRRTVWACQAVGALNPLLCLVCSGLYHRRVRPQLRATERALGLAVRGSRTLPSTPEVTGEPPALPIRIAPPRLAVLVIVPSLIVLYLVLGLDLRLGSIYLGVLVLTQLWSGVTLRDDCAVVRGLRRRRVPWNDVVDVTQQHVVGSWQVVLLTGSGQRFTLRAPTTFFGLGTRRFDREYDLIRRTWLARRDRRPEGIAAGGR